MKTILIKGNKRDSVGKKATKAVRNEGQVPCVIYGKSGNEHFSVYEYDFKNLVYTPNSYLVQINIDGNKKLAKLQDIQFHPVNERINHVDFLEVELDKPITMGIPVKVVGNAPGVRAGGKLMIKIKKLTVKGMIKDLPDAIEVNIDKLEIGNNFRVSDLKSDVLTFLDTPANSIVSVTATRASISAAAEAEKGSKKK